MERKGADGAATVQRRCKVQMVPKVNNTLMGPKHAVVVICGQRLGVLFGLGRRMRNYVLASGVAVLLDQYMAMAFWSENWSRE